MFRESRDRRVASDGHPLPSPLPSLAGFAKLNPMSSEKATAIVLRTVDFSETSLILTLFTREFGKVQVLAKGGRRLKGPFDSALDLLTLCRIVFLRKSSDALDLLTEAKLVRRFRIPGRDLASLYAGYYVAELLGELTDRYDACPELFDLADEALLGLSVGEPVANHVVRFELGALRCAGHMPSLSICVECDHPVPMTGRVAFGHLDGGVLCGRCRSGKRQVASVNAGVLRIMAQLADPASRVWRRIEIDPRSRGELRGLMNQYLWNLLERKPRMHQYLGLLSS
jgi:DNA repair protein RecO (recombination protein O)